MKDFFWQKTEAIANLVSQSNQSDDKDDDPPSHEVLENKISHTDN